MSLLNDALRDAEQRQTRPQVTGTYTGQPVVQQADTSKTPLIIGLLAILVLIGGAGTWWLLSDDVVAPVAETAGSSALVVPEPAAPAASPEPTPLEPVPEQPAAVAVPEPQPEMPVAKAESEPESEAPAVAVTASSEAEPTEPAAPQRTVFAEPKEPAPTFAPEQVSTANQASAEPVKQQRETREAVDLRTSRELSRLLAAGQNTEAERVLRALTDRQTASRSREVFAREMLVQGMAAQALEWLPDVLTKEHVNLRLLKARALLDQGELNRAIATLSASVPPVADQVEYRITLATLLQQAGDADEAAGHWSELIAFDDSKAAWWLGLAIALETGGRYRSAVQAYAQAMTMPGLSASLADYARERLNALQAGS
ncbi:MAG: hypothetical protein HLUCCX14_12665 [Marinobacter excellens HL-55]|uniref:Uncharacterized protein n=1 Tax=Marinobacter excellens HL-55 TaxID=1305731 RepID=A0A0P8BI90_9GAMM|nr:MAG: hypothetical protein HLUCCX14_12665 [Marinobacter excellens HL-55]